MFKSITSRLLAAFGILALVVVCSLSFITVDTIQTDKRAAEEELETSIATLEALLVRQQEFASSLASGISGNARLNEALQQEDFEKIPAAVQAFYETFKDQTGLSVLEIGDNTGTVLYRAHDPEDFGDSKLDNPAIALTLQGNSPSGLEMGESGIAIRAFAPVTIGQEVIGTVQTGYTDAFFETYKAISKSNIDIYTHEGLLYTTDQNSLKTDSKLQENLKGALSGKTIGQKTGDEYYKLIPIKDPTDSEVIGAFKVSYDLKHMNDEIKKLILITALMGLFFAATIIAIVIYFLKNLVAPIKLLSNEVTEIADYDLSSEKLATDKKLLKNKSEVGQLANATLKMKMSSGP